MGGDQAAKRTRKGRVGYFCMEYGVKQELSLYGGGLGILAGDIVKECHDSRTPLTGIGIFWNEGYTKQGYEVNECGKENSNVQVEVQDSFPSSDRSQLSQMKLDSDITVTLDGKEVRIVAHRVKDLDNLILLEPAEEEDQKKYTSRLYQGGDDLRVAQEIILGVGGVRMLRAAKIDVDVYHFNEGHAVFAGLELLREEVAKGKQGDNKPPSDSVFKAAWENVKKRIIFTTHTPVPAGNEQHPIDRLLRMGAACGLSEKQLEEIGGNPFGMTVAGLRLAYLSNAVAQLHGETARDMWKDVKDASDIIAITNGVHCPSWQDPKIADMVEDLDATVTLEVERKLQDIHQTAKKNLFDEVKSRSGVVLDPSVLTIGFARRAATYKRANLIFQDIKKIEEHITKNDVGGNRVQFVFAGKAHPNDEGGKELIREIVALQQKYPAGIVYVPNYDMKLGALLTRGCDVWLNNPRRPLEASGTSGMKAAMNGVLNLSILDGWWPEACKNGVNGWAIGDDKNREEEDAAKFDREALVEKMTNEVLPCFYEKAADGQVRKWTQMQVASIKDCTYQFSATRMMKEYYDLMYDKQPVVA